MHLPLTAKVLRAAQVSVKFSAKLEAELTPALCGRSETSNFVLGFDEAQPKAKIASDVRAAA